ncbi:oxygen-independent coproporphyrinogen-3 oxidase [Catalinimonas alkaloidigena]|uniref:oxygen-independent coproporphyrinogen III oxidase n=1 Tax=Catalinimonas alkaloidigena TaxID=1075417 RepID=UPI002406C3B0|nr:oxygen-independent coproporphyrinogen III oxidase [Catalinimonas alkaloidigena]MDF9795993.1 oxygen-independent coproporphyrinogen-3 oxidase [Catalinimonas alkaloidigena]
MNTSFIRKYNVPGPRYTSYPTVPYWDKTPPSEEQWKAKVKATYEGSKKDGLSIYVHLPYCESLCTYCGCNTRITVNHAVEMPYIDTLLKEWQMYTDLLGEKPLIKEIHLGGGTPTFFSPQNLQILIQTLLAQGKLSTEAEMGFEAHPNNTTAEHMQVLYNLGFRRLSLGIQDFDPEVQKIVHRIQPFEKVKEVTELARKIGYTSINFDLIYGLPLQTIATVKDTIEKTLRLQPDRIAFYSYAHVPWLKPAQKKYEQHLPTNEVKRNLYEMGKGMLEENGYHEIGMDHFARKSDSLYIASQQGKLHRNFMGYSTTSTKLLIGLGASSISDTWTAFGQNIKPVEAYMKSVNEGHLPVYRGHLLTEEDLVVRQHILNLMCHFRTSWDKKEGKHEILDLALNRLTEMTKDRIIHVEDHFIEVSEKGKPFLRNVCMALDARMWKNKPESALFSNTI